jgi:hypothetical protein
MNRKIPIILIVIILAVVILTVFSNQSSVACNLTGGKFRDCLKDFCYDCYCGCDSWLRGVLDFILRGGKPAYLG